MPLGGRYYDSQDADELENSSQKESIAQETLKQSGFRYLWGRKVQFRGHSSLLSGPCVQEHEMYVNKDKSALQCSIYFSNHWRPYCNSRNTVTCVAVYKNNNVTVAATMFPRFWNWICRPRYNNSTFLFGKSNHRLQFPTKAYQGPTSTRPSFFL